MSTIKKGYVEVYNILVENQDKEVSEIMDLVVPIMESLQRDKNHYRDDDGNLYIFCYYHKQWEMVKQVEYGLKANTATGFNSMCKVGTNQWTRQQREFKKSKSDLLDEVSQGLIEPSDIQERIEVLEDEKDNILSLSDHWNIVAYTEIEKTEEKDD